MKKAVWLVWVLGVAVRINLSAQAADTLYESQLITGIGGIQCAKLYYEAGLLKAVRDTFTDYQTASTNATIHNPLNGRTFLTNGLLVINDQKQMAENSNCLVDNEQCTVYRKGSHTIQGMVFIPSKDQKVWLVYQSGDDTTSNEARRLYWAELDMAYNNGQGRITKSKQMLLDGPVLSPSEMTQVRHANGRDWWVVQPGRVGLMYHVFLVTPDTIVLDHVQTIGDSVVGGLWGMARFSAQGDRYCITGVDSPPQLFDFDRCSGYFSNPVKICTNDPSVNFRGDTTYRCNGRLGCIFSPNGRFVYINSYSDIRQYDLQADRPLDESYVTIAEYDSTFSTNGDPSAFFYAIQALDNKLYYCTWAASSKGYQVIHSPDSLGAACRFEEGGLSAPTLRVYSPLPNIPFYRLGKLEGSSCDTIVSNRAPTAMEYGVQLRPNPGSRVELLLEQTPKSPLGFTLHNLQSKTMLELNIVSASTNIDLSTLPAGMYFWQVRNAEGRLLQTGRQVVQY